MRDEAVLRAVERLKTNPFGTTGIKVELEASLCRDESDSDALEIVLNNMAMKVGLSSFNNFVVYNEECDVCGEYAEDEAHIHNPLPGIVYARCYNDGSVDTEITFTVSVNKSENVFLLPKMLSAFDDYCLGYEDDYDVEGAGMHIALINTPDCSYPGSANTANMNRFRNFRKSMQLLLPALYFLSAHNDTTRGLSMREPRIGCTENSHGHEKFSAVNYTHGAIEFRVFDTCYDKPDAILDNIVVMANCMRYWRRSYLASGLERVIPSIMFGSSGSRSLQRLYTTTQHIDLLNAGLVKLKPSYYTITELKKQRNFSVDRRAYEQRVQEVRKEVEKGYEEYKQRWEWNWSRWLHQAVEDKVYPRYIPENDQEFQELAQQIQPWMESAYGKLQDLEEFVEVRVNERLPQGNWRLSPEAC
jgi:hypothetical protein